MIDNYGISIHALREEGDTLAHYQLIEDSLISIHALREEGDQTGQRIQGIADISIHALREEGDSLTRGTTATTRTFLSTPSVRRATV